MAFFSVSKVISSASWDCRQTGVEAEMFSKAEELKALLLMTRVEISLIPQL